LLISDLSDPGRGLAGVTVMTISVFPTLRFVALAIKQGRLVDQPGDWRPKA